GRVWLHDLQGKQLQPLTDTSEAGYYARFDERTWVLFMNDKQRRIVIYDAKTKALDTMAVNASTAPYRIPGATRAVTFVGEGKTLQRLDVKKPRVTTLTTIPFKTGGHHVWTSRGTILMASGNTIYEWSPAQPNDWKPVWKSEHPDLQGITRIALSPNADRIALVSTPRDATIIRDSRAASNRFLAEHRPDATASLYQKEATVITSKNVRLDGRAAIEKLLTEQFAERPDLVYVRTPSSIDVSKTGDVAAERGTWTAHASTMDVRGEYLAVWQREITDSGTPSWTIRSELFVALE
ncbi:MAG TPA: nuclear transport factor 2 family protein, partial [Thermoanaerobaculia bacterium]|nr:nuclear transport factor 2 family protein [Thermoanaerobaculia bacterium]